MLLQVTQIDYNTIAIFILLLVIIYFVSGFNKRIAAITKSSTAHHYLNTAARIKSLDYAPNGIVSIDIDGLVVSWSGGATTMFGYTEEEMLGKSLEVIMPPEYISIHTNALAKLKEGGTSTRLGKPTEFEALNRKGVRFPIQVTLWKWNEGPNTYYTGIIRDITEKKKKEVEINNFLRMYERGEDVDNSGVWSWDVIKDIVYVSEGFKRIFNIDKNIVDSTYLLRRVYHEDLKKVEEVIKEAFETKGGYKLRYRLVRMDGVIVEVEVNANTYLDENQELINITGTIHTV